MPAGRGTAVARAGRPPTGEGAGPHWAHRSPDLQGLSFRFAVRCTDRELGRYLESLLAPLGSVAPAEHRYSLVTMPDGGVEAWLDDVVVAGLRDGAEAVSWFLSDLNRSVVDASTEHLIFHAGAVEHRGAGILLPAPSGSGKSTLVAALVRRGLGYLSDEVVALSASGERFLAFPKPLAVKPGSFRTLGELEPVLAGPWAAFSGGQWHLPPAGIREGAVGRACTPRLVVVPRYVPGACTTLTALPKAEAFLAAAFNTVHFDRLGARGARLLGELVERCDCYVLEMSDLGEACRLVLGLLGPLGA